MTVTVAVVSARTTTAAMPLPAVSATQVADAVMSQSEPSITRNSSVSCTFVTVITNERKVWVAWESESAAAAELKRARLLPPSVNVPVAPVAVRVGSSLTSVTVTVYDCCTVSPLATPWTVIAVPPASTWASSGVPVMVAVLSPLSAKDIQDRQEAQERVMVSPSGSFHVTVEL